MTNTGKDTKPAVKIEPAQLAGNVFWLISGELFSRLIAFGISIYLARVLGAAGFGLIGAAFAIVSYFSVVVRAGLDPIGTRETAHRPQDMPSIFARITGLRLIIAVVSSFMLLFLLYLLPVSIISRPDVVLIFALMLFAEATSTLWALRGIEKMRFISIGLVAQHVLMAIGILWLVKGPDPDLRIVAAVQAGSLLTLQALYYWELARRFGPMRPTFHIRNLLPSVREVVPVTLGQVSRMFYYQGDVLLLSWLATEASAGDFLASHKIIMSLAMLGTMSQMNAFPTTSRLCAEDPASAFRFQITILRYSLIILIPLIVIGAWISDWLIILFYGKEYINAVGIFFWMLFTLPLLLATQGMQNLLLVIGRARYYLFGNALIAIVHVLLGIWLIPQLDSMGAVFASIGAEAVGLVCMTAFVMRFFKGVSLWNWQLFAPVFSGLIMGGTFILTEGLPLVISLLLGLTIYLLVTASSGSLQRAEFLWVWNLTRKGRGDIDRSLSE